VKRWTEDIDPASIPGAVLKSERARRKAAKRISYSGGIYWKTAQSGCIMLPLRALHLTTRSRCQRKVEMSYSLQSRNVRFSSGGVRVRDSLGVPVKRRRAMLASNPIEE